MEVSKDNAVGTELYVVGYVLGSGIRKKVVGEAFNIKYFNSAYSALFYKYVRLFVLFFNLFLFIYFCF